MVAVDDQLALHTLPGREVNLAAQAVDGGLEQLGRLGVGRLVAVLLALACIPLFIGLAVALPVLGYASWHLYTRLVDRGA